MTTDDPRDNEPVIANPNHVEDIHAPLIFADGCFNGGPMLGDNLTLTFVAKILDGRMNPPGPATKTVLRLVLPRRSAKDMAEFVTKLLGDIESGSAPPAAGATIN